MWHGYFLWLCKIIKAGCSHCFQLPTFCRPCQSCTEQKRRPNQQVVMVPWNRKQLQCNWSLHRFNWLNPSISSPTITMTVGKNFLHTLPFVRFKFFDVLYWWPSWKSPSPPFTWSSFWILHMLKAYPLWPANKNSDVHYFIATWNSKQPFFNGCFIWMIPTHYMKSSCFTEHPLKTGCLEFQVMNYFRNRQEMSRILSRSVRPSRGKSCMALIHLQDVRHGVVKSEKHCSQCS